MGVPLGSTPIPRLYVRGKKMKWLSSIFKPSKKEPTELDRDFGEMFFDGDEVGIWQTEGSRGKNPEIGFCAIPGNDVAPFNWARAVALEKKENAEHIWNLCLPILEKIRSEWGGFKEEESARESFTLVSIGIDEDYQTSSHWQAGFDAKTHKHGIYATIYFTEDTIISHTCDT